MRRDDDALAMLGLLGYDASEVINDPLLGVNLRLCTHPSFPAVEIVMPGEGQGPIDAILRRHDQLLYHTCYEVVDRAAVLYAFERADLRTIEVVGPTPAVLFGGRKVSFHSVMGFGLVELLECE